MNGPNYNSTTIVELDLYKSNVGGTNGVSKYVSLLQDLYSLRLPSNQIAGPLPTAAQLAIPELHILDLQYNRFSGPIPTDYMMEGSSIGTYLHTGILIGKLSGSLAL